MHQFLFYLIIIMGNNSSTSNEPMDIKSLSSQIDDIAIHYILKQNTIDLLRLTDKEYYDNLILLVGNLFEKKLSDIEIGSMNQRIYPQTVQNAVLDFLPSNGKLKETMIRNISKFYMKIMMIFSAIVATIDPQYSYEDDQGNTQLFYLKDLNSYKHIPRHVQPLVHQLTNPMNLCRKRISILRNKIDLTDPDFITINPGEKLCSTDSTKHLTDEIGIKELDLLYYDVFDPSSKTWKHRSKEMEEKYQNDLVKFYTIFTGNEEMPPHIKSFKDIELFDYRSIGYCRDTLFTQDYVVPKNDELIVRYKEQVELLEKSTILYRTELLEHLKTLFLTKIDENNMTYTIDPSLTMETILKVETDTRNCIINLYTNCEQYFIRALLIFEELYDNQSNSMNQSRLTNIPLYKEQLKNMNTPNSFQMTTRPNSFQPPVPVPFPGSFLNPIPNAISPPVTVPPNSMPSNSMKVSLNTLPALSNPTLPQNSLEPPFASVPPLPNPMTSEPVSTNTFSSNSPPEPPEPKPFTPEPVSTNAPPETVSTNPFSTNAPPETVSTNPFSTNAPPETVSTNPFSTNAPPETVSTNPVSTNAPPEPVTTNPFSTNAPPETVSTNPFSTNAPPETVSTNPVSTNAPPEPVTTNPFSTNAPPETVSTNPFSTNAPPETVSTNAPPEPVSTNAPNAPNVAPTPMTLEPASTNAPKPFTSEPVRQELQVTQSPEPMKVTQSPEPEKKNTLLENVVNLFKGPKP
jgi:hypothetical protein